MFTLDKKEYDETKLDDKGKIAFNNVKVLTKEKNDLLHSLEKNKILSNDLYNDMSDNAGLDKWIQDAFDGKMNNCWKRMRSEWTTKLMDDDSFTDPIPSNQEAFVNLVTARSDYKTRKQRDDA